MTKSLEQIQQENRKFILEAIGEYKNELKLLEQQEHQIYHEIISKSFYSKSLTLSRVLLAFKNKDIKNLYGDRIIFNIAGSQFCGLQLNPLYSLYGASDWNLELETLEKQTENTQRAINKLFND